MSYFTETFPTSIDVRVTFTHYGEVDSFEDAIKGNDVMHAIERAHENWPGAAVEFLGVTDPTTINERAEATGTFGWADGATWSPELADEPDYAHLASHLADDEAAL